jgi:hypothetical protein
MDAGTIALQVFQPRDKRENLPRNRHAQKERPPGVRESVPPQVVLRQVSKHIYPRGNHALAIGSVQRGSAPVFPSN